MEVLSVSVLHLVPSYFKSNFSKFNRNCSVTLIKYEIPELNLCLTDEDLMTRHPFVNKAYSIGCKRKGRKAINGFLLGVENLAPTLFTIIETWRITLPATTIEAVHVINTGTVDNDFPMYTQDKRMFNEMKSSDYTPAEWGDYNFKRRGVCGNKSANTMDFPKTSMVFSSYEDEHFPNMDTILYNKEHGVIKYKEETIDYPTIELERYQLRYNHIDDRLPSLDDMFTIKNKLT